MSGSRLEVKVHIVTGAQSAAENILKCVRRCGLDVERLVLNPSASSAAVLSEDERDLGVAMVDIGAGTTDVAIFTDGSIRHTAVIPIAGDLITSDIAMALRTPTKDAEEIKVEYGVAKQLLADPSEQVEVPGLGDRSPRMLSRQALAGVIEPRIEEIFSLVHQVIRESGYEELLSSGVVLTEDEKDLGVALVDIGAGTTDVAIFTDGSIRHTAVIPIAGDLITSDIAMALRTPTKDAEEIKVEYGVAKQLLADPSENLEVPGLGDRAPRMLSRQALAGVIEPRIEEIYSLVHQVIRESGYEELLSSGIVITGGAAVMPGMVELGEDIFLKPVRRGNPTYHGALFDMVSNPRSATVMGLLEEARIGRARGLRAAQQAGSVQTLFGRVKDWFLGNF
jgi:cell division ATPase FtsA